jgi:hypothetical protein
VNTVPLGAKRRPARVLPQEEAPVARRIVFQRAEHAIEAALVAEARRSRLVDGDETGQDRLLRRRAGRIGDDDPG